MNRRPSAALPDHHGAAAAPAIDPILAIQRGLEALYRVETQLDVRDFLVTSAQRDALVPSAARRPREQLLVHHSPKARSSPPPQPPQSPHPGDEDVELALYLDEDALATLRRHDPREGLSEDNLAPLLLALEGISHFIYTAVRAHAGRPVSALELELQAEVDKYVSLLLLLWSPPPARTTARAHHRGEDLPAWLIRRLFHQVVFDPALSGEERDRYREANHAAARYAAVLRRRYPPHAPSPRGPRDAPSASDALGLLQDVRRFWRFSCAEKLSHIQQRA